MKGIGSQRTLLLGALALFGGGIATGMYLADSNEGLLSEFSLTPSAQAQAPPKNGPKKL